MGWTHDQLFLLSGSYKDLVIRPLIKKSLIYLILINSMKSQTGIEFKFVLGLPNL